MEKFDPKELDDIRKEVDGIIQTHRPLLNHEPKLLKPLEQVRDAAKFKYLDLASKDE